MFVEMMKRKIICTIVISMLLLTVISSTSTIAITTSKKGQNWKNPLNLLSDSAELPTWCIGNYWKYNMNLIFLTRNDNGKIQLDIDADITDMYATMTGSSTMDGEEVYVLTIDGEINGDIGLFGIFDVSELRGDFSGNAYISKNTLGIKKFLFEVDGEVFIPVLRWRDLYFELSLDFDPCFDFFDFPIEDSEDPWDVHIDEAKLDASVDIDVLGGTHKEFSDSMEFDDEMQLLNIQQVTVPAGTFESYLLSGSWGQLSKLWYSPDVGYLSKVNETLVWDDGKIESEFNLALLETNYDENNNPPETPQTPSGIEVGEVNTEYTYTTTTTDPNVDDIEFMFDWGDNTNSGWLGPYKSGAVCSASKSWANKGVYNVMAKARDYNRLESEWSDPLVVTICGPSKINVTMKKVEGKDDIDVLSDPEWYYKVIAVSEDNSTESETNHNTDNGKYNGNWTSEKIWNVGKSHELLVQSRFVIVKLKLMDYDSVLEFGSDDLADVSGCNYPDNDGVNDDTPNKRGAIYHGTYDLVTNELKGYHSNPDEYADYVTVSNDTITTCGDYAPDSSTEFEGGLIPNPENDAIIDFTLSNDYSLPEAVASVVNMPGKLRPGYVLKFRGAVIGGNPQYIWHWSFGDTTTSGEQNPEHSYSKAGVYTVVLTIIDAFGQTSSDTLMITVYDNQNPTNLKISGPTNGGTNKKYDYKVSATDPDEDELYYQIDWGDGENTGWLGPFSSGQEITQSHSWAQKDTYTITFSVKDHYFGYETKTLSVTMPRSLTVQTQLLNLFKQHPIIYQILKKLIKI